MWAIETKQLTKIYKRGLFVRKSVKALDQLSLQIAPGEIFGMVGHNGAGKTTTFKLLLGLIRPTSGEAWILGEPIGSVRGRQQVGFLPEQPYFYDQLTATQFLEFYAHLFGLDHATRRRRIAMLLERVGLSGEAATPLRRFSKGMLQRIGIAQALVNDPQVVILDEPMSGLDPIGRKEVRDLILDLRHQGKTILFSSHILADVEMICDRVAILANGMLQQVQETPRLFGKGRRMVELFASDLNARALEELRQLALDVRQQVEGVAFLIPDEQRAEAAQEIIREQGGRLLALIPQTPSLESLFLNEGAPVGSGRPAQMGRAHRTEEEAA